MRWPPSMPLSSTSRGSSNSNSPVGARRSWTSEETTTSPPVAWFAILATGRYPQPLFNYVVGVGRWSLRVNAYAFLLVTDRYPPFSLKAG